jgi:hypothetical protein
VGGNADFNNRQLHASERMLAQQLAKKSGGKYTVQQIEDAMRNSGNSAFGEDIATGMVVEPSKPSQIYDKGASFTTYDNGQHLVEVNRDGSQLDPGKVDPSLAAFIRTNTGGSNSPCTSFAPVLAMPALSSSGVAANGLRYEMRTANGQSFRVPVADCPAVSCQNSDNVARYGLNPEDQAQVQAYDAALNKQTIKGVTTIAVVGVAAPVAVEGIVANALLGGAVSGTISAKDQYIDNGKVDAGKTVQDAVVGAVATGALVAAAPAVAAGTKAVGQTLDDIVAAKVVSQAEVDAAAAAQQAARVENNIRRDDGQQYDNFRNPASSRPGGEWDWQKEAPNGGAVPGTQATITIAQGVTLDRYGYRGGEYMSPAGTAFEARALPPGKLADPYEQYLVAKPFTVVQENIAPAFGQVGGGVQLRAQIPEVPGKYATVDDLIKYGYLKVKS